MFRQAGLEPLAMSAFGRESMVYGPAAASEGKRMDFSGGIARVVSYSNGGTARCDRAPFGLSQFGCACQAGASGQGSAHDLTPLAGHGAKEQWPVKTEWRVKSEETVASSQWSVNAKRALFPFTFCLLPFAFHVASEGEAGLIAVKEKRRTKPICSWC